MMTQITKAPERVCEFVYIWAEYIKEKLRGYKLPQPEIKWKICPSWSMKDSQLDYSIHIFESILKIRIFPIVSIDCLRAVPRKLRHFGRMIAAIKHASDKGSASSIPRNFPRIFLLYPRRKRLQNFSRTFLWWSSPMNFSESGSCEQ